MSPSTVEQLKGRASLGQLGPGPFLVPGRGEDSNLGNSMPTKRQAATILAALDQAQAELVGKAVILTDGKVGTVDKIWLDERADTMLLNATLNMSVEGYGKAATLRRGCIGSAFEQAGRRPIVRMMRTIISRATAKGPQPDSAMTIPRRRAGATSAPPRSGAHGGRSAQISGAAMCVTQRIGLNSDIARCRRLHLVAPL
jgi:hypothetical protein